jgi:DNA-binding HxlR family transcriptional regulator
VAAVLWQLGALRFVELLHELGASRDTLTETLGSLLESGLIERKAAEGERYMAYTLTASGKRLAPLCLECVAAARELDARRVALKKWPMVVLVGVGRGQARYNALKADLPGITPRALAAALKDLETDGFVTRGIEEGYPPRTHYRLTERGEQLLPPMAALIEACETLSLTSLAARGQ